MNYLGIDVGTGGTRALIMDERGTVVASASAEHQNFASPRPGWAEQDPRDWWQACGAAVRQALQSGKVRAEDIGCVGFSGQMHGAVLLDSADEVVRPALIWCDQRSEAQCRELEESIGRDALIRLTCNPPLKRRSPCRRRRSRRARRPSAARRRPGRWPAARPSPFAPPDRCARCRCRSGRRRCRTFGRRASVDLVESGDRVLGRRVGRRIRAAARAPRSSRC